MQKRIVVLTAVLLAAALAPAVGAQEASDAEEAVKMVATQWQDAWNGGDMDAIGALYAEDSDYVDLFGETFKGREQIQANFTEIHSTVYNGGKISIETTSVQFVKPDVAVADSAWEMSGLAEAEGVPSKGVSTAVMVKQDEDWKIVAHRTRVPAPSILPKE
jgi:uncharacterized protein (TIGR02246 family)